MLPPIAFQEISRISQRGRNNNLWRVYYFPDVRGGGQDGEMGPGGALPPPWRPLPPTAPAVCPPACADAVVGPPGPPHRRRSRTRPRIRSVPRVLFQCCSSVVLLLFSGVPEFRYCCFFFRIVLLLFRCCSKGSVLFPACFRGVFLVMSHRVHPRSSVVQNCPQSAARFHPFLLQDSRLVPPSCSALFQYCSSIVFSQRSVSSSPLERYH